LWDKIFYTPGNREFYSGKKNYDTLNFEYELKIKEKYKNIFYLNRNSVSLNDDIDVYGCVFWTIPPSSIYTYLNDYREIKQFSETTKYNIPIDSVFITNLSNNDFKSISDYLNKINTQLIEKKQTIKIEHDNAVKNKSEKNKSEKNKKIIIITHFPPTQENTMALNCVEKSQELKNYYAWNNILDSLNLKNVIAWISGHTHWSYDNNYNNIRLISNQFGFKKEVGLTGVKEIGLFEIEYTNNII
jgi:hypothetical protein